MEDPLTRRQLTLFVPADAAGAIETTRREFNAAQHALIAAHVTLCREDEFTTLDLPALRPPLTSIAIDFGEPIRFADGLGVLLPALPCEAFQTLRRSLLGGLPRHHQPHITLVHPRNGACTDRDFANIAERNFPQRIVFNTISLIEQRDGGKWNVLKEYKLSEEKSR